MINIKLQKIKRKKGPAPYGAKGSRSGFVILFAVFTSAIILSVSLGVANIALKELNFSTSSRGGNDAFYAADSAVECALVNDKSTGSSFIVGGPGSVNCFGSSIALNGSFPSWDFVIPGSLGGLGQACAKVSVFKDDVSAPPIVITTINSRGYNVGDSACNSTNPNREERELEVVY